MAFVSSSSSSGPNPFLRLLTWAVFTCLDLLDVLLCVVFSYIDQFLEGGSGSHPCYCHRRSSPSPSSDCCSGGGESSELSETLFRRRNVFRGSNGKMQRISVVDDADYIISEDGEEKKRSAKTNGAVRWSDCGCECCVSWTKQTDPTKLHVAVREPSRGGGTSPETTENVMFLHGFISSSSLWTETVFPNLSDNSARLFAVDLLGFGRSPKPRDCDYTMKDHLDAIEKSVPTTISPSGSESFHLVGHSMGCIIALALAARHPASVKSVTLVAPPYFPYSDTNDASMSVLEILAAKRLWPPLLFGAAVMSWYEHLGRVACFLICRTHRFWEPILKLITGPRELSFLITDIVRHTHHSGWHTMHNVICGGAKLMDAYLETLAKFGVKLVVIQGDRDQLVPLECSRGLVSRVAGAELRVAWGEDHNSVILRRPKEFTRDLQGIWASSSTGAPRLAR